MAEGKKGAKMMTDTEKIFLGAGAVGKTGRASTGGGAQNRETANMGAAGRMEGDKRKKIGENCQKSAAKFGRYDEKEASKGKN